MFFLTYLWRELRQRMRQTIVTALGLAVGVGLVLTVTAASAGVGNAQAAVLHSLYGIGTDITVTKEKPSIKPESSSDGLMKPGPVEEHKDSVATMPGLDLLDASSVDAVARLGGVSAAAGGLALTDTRVDIPAAGSESGNGLALPTSFTVDGVDLAHTNLGPFASVELSSGRSLTASDANSMVAVLDSAYAGANNLTVGSKITIANTAFTVIGTVKQARGGGASDVYIPLPRAQALPKPHGADTLAGKVDQIYVVAANSTLIPELRKAISAVVPSATVTSATSLADAVSGSLASAAGLTTKLGRWLAVVVLIAAFAIASLLSIAAVARRVREFGTLKALGWRSRRIVLQLLGESTITGIIGAAMGVALGFGGAALVGALAPPLSATVATNPGSTPPEVVNITDNGMHHSDMPGSTHTIAVHLTAPVTLTAIGLAVGLAIAGGLIAGCLGGWRAARLRPATALSRIG